MLLFLFMWSLRVLSLLYRSLCWYKTAFYWVYYYYSNLGISCATLHPYKPLCSHSHCKIFYKVFGKAHLLKQANLQLWWLQKTSMYIPIRAPYPFSHILWNKEHIPQWSRSFSAFLHFLIISENPSDQRLLFDPRKRLTVTAVAPTTIHRSELQIRSGNFFFFFF